VARKRETKETVVSTSTGKAERKDRTDDGCWDSCGCAGSAMGPADDDEGVGETAAVPPDESTPMFTLLRCDTASQSLTHALESAADAPTLAPVPASVPVPIPPTTPPLRSACSKRSRARRSSHRARSDSARARTSALCRRHSTTCASYSAFQASCSAAETEAEADGDADGDGDKDVDDGGSAGGGGCEKGETRERLGGTEKGSESAACCLFWWVNWFRQETMG
jgi:hypothetical protein